ncbi:MAG TPA: UxaA family hydrolase [Deltaproteobacteria bacterium]|jgi:predicted RecA/RadA family phage recombinase|nr:UxaA family hydrolase [Deltaproteobacteria bacterium]HOI08555.1 UxaA family hydrolase [Deltaproteobacteria bacterium]
MHNVVVINPEDNVGVALADIARGQEARLSTGLAFPVVEDIPYSHKVAIRDIGSGEAIRKYGEEIGFARADIRQGGWVHTHNLEIREE